MEFINTITKRVNKMQKIHLLVEDDYIQTLMQMLPRDKVTVIEENFEENKILLQDSLQNYRDAKDSFVPYQDSIEELNSWLSTKESK